MQHGDGVDGVEKVRRLLNPRNVVIVGATERPTSWAGRIRENLRTFGFPGPVYAVNPKYERLWDEPCYPDVAALPEPPDHLVMLTPARMVPAQLEDAAKAGARSATVFASGFGEDGGPEGAANAAALRAVLERTGLAISGPNCLGNVCASSRLVTLTDRRLTDVQEGPISIVAQSGGIAMAINRRLTERGLFAAHVITSGNEIGLATADYLDYFVSTGKTRVVTLFLEGLGDPAKFLAAVERARDAGVAVLALKIGGSEKSRQAALAHTGALAGSLEAFDAVAGRAGVSRVETVDELVDAADALAGGARARGAGMAAITFSGGARGLLEESAARRGVAFAELEPATVQKLDSLLGVGGGVGNPLDSGYTGLTNKQAYLECVEALIGDPNVDILLAQGELPQGEGAGTGIHKDETIAMLDRRAAETGTPIVMFSLANQNISDAGRALRATCRNIGFVQGPDQAVVVGRLLGRAAELARPTQAPPADPDRRAQVRELLAQGGDAAWDEVRSKALLARYGIRSPQEQQVSSAEEAAAAAEQIGFPVTLKVVLDGIAHKTEVGGILLELSSPEQVRDGFTELQGRMEQRGLSQQLRGVLVAEHVAGGVELALGVHRDVEMGPVVMVGLGGVWLEVLADVRFGAVPLDADEARGLLSGTRTERLLAGVRGAAAADVDAVVDALVGLSQLAADCGDLLESIDVNPFTALERGKGAVALDALVVPRAPAGAG